MENDVATHLVYGNKMHACINDMKSNVTDKSNYTGLDAVIGEGSAAKRVWVTVSSAALNDCVYCKM